MVNLELDHSAKSTTRWGHVALKCYRRFDHNYQAEENNRVAAAIASTVSSYGVNPNWYMDTGATYHITDNLDKLTLKDKYSSKDMVQIASGSGMRILHVGLPHITTPCKSLQLNNVLYIPQSSRQLLSVHQFIANNKVFLEFHPSSL